MSLTMLTATKAAGILKDAHAWLVPFLAARAVDLGVISVNAVTGKALLEALTSKRPRGVFPPAPYSLFPFMYLSVAGLQVHGSSL